MSGQKFKKEIVFIVIFPTNVTTKVCNSTEIHNCKKCKLFGMSRQCRTPSKVAHVIQTLSVLFNAGWYTSPSRRCENVT